MWNIKAPQTFYRRYNHIKIVYMGPKYIYSLSEWFLCIALHLQLWERQNRQNRDVQSCSDSVCLLMLTFFPYLPYTARQRWQTHKRLFHFLSYLIWLSPQSLLLPKDSFRIFLPLWQLVTIHLTVPAFTQIRLYSATEKYFESTVIPCINIAFN